MNEYVGSPQYSMLWILLAGSIALLFIPSSVALSQTGSISGVIYFDENGNGSRDDSLVEYGLDGWGLEYYSPIDSGIVTTDTNGAYSINVLGGAEYWLTIQVPAGWQPTVPAEGRRTISLGVGESYPDENFGVITSGGLGTISGYKYHDLNTNGQYDFGEPKLSDWRIKIEGPITREVITDDTGAFHFTEVPSGTYAISEFLKTGWTSISPPNGYDSISVSLHQNIEFNFGNYQSSGMISGMVFWDKNGNGQLDTLNLEVPLQGRTVTLSSDTSISAITDNKGKYSFTDLPNGTYTLSEVLPTGWGQTSPGVPGTYELTLDSTTRTFINKDFGCAPSVETSIGGRVFNDLNGNCLFDESFESVQTEWYVTATSIYDPQFPFSTTVQTDSSGHYSFENLPLGLYRITENTRVNWDHACPADTFYHDVLLIESQPQSTSNDFGVKLLNAKVNGYVAINLLNVSGDTGYAGKTGLSGMSVSINGPTTMTTLTDAAGRYSFNDLPDGEYLVQQNLPIGWEQIEPAYPSYAIHIDSTHRVFSQIMFLNRGTGGISGKVYFEDGEPCLDGGEPGLVNWLLRLTPPPFIRSTYLWVASDDEGKYVFDNLPPGDYGLNEVLKPLWVPSCPAGGTGYSISLNAGEYDTSSSFGNSPSSTFQNLSVSVVGGTARPGFTTDYNIRGENRGTVSVSSILTFTHPENTTYLPQSSDPPDDNYDSLSRTVTWNLGVLPPGALRIVTASVQIASPPTVNIGQTLTAMAHIGPIDGDQFLADNDDVEIQEVSGSFDPNDKLAHPAGVGPENIITGDTRISYTIRFQNTGNDTAFSILVRDTLDANLDPASLEIGAASHPFLFIQPTETELIWQFANIMLPDSIVNEPKSHGFLKYEVKPKSGLLPGTQIQNRAGIYFDFNLPVITNTVMHSIGEGGSLWLQLRDKWNLISLPCIPTIDSLTVLIPNRSSQAYRYQPNSGYDESDRLESGVGYWIKSPGIQAVYFQGDPISRDTVELLTGWNMVGTITQPISCNSIGSSDSALTTSQFFSYVGGYVAVDTLLPGHGYWVKADRPGQLVLSAGDSTGGKNKIHILPTSEQPPQPPSESPVILPVQYGLAEIYPNPFNPTANIQYSLPVKGDVRLELFTQLGERVVTLVNEVQTEGTHVAGWNGSNYSSGVYYLKLTAGPIVQIKKLILLK